MQCAGGAFSNQRGQWKTFALADFKGGFGFSVPVSLPFAANTALFDHVEPFYRALVRCQHHIAIGVESQRGMLGIMGQMCIVHV